MIDSIQFYQCEIVEKGWGAEKVIVNNNLYCGKILSFNPNRKFSFHFHDEKTETFYVLSGGGTLEYFSDLRNCKRDKVELKEGDVVHIPRGNPHSINSSSEGLTIIEFSTPHQDSDSYRIEKGDSQK